MGLHFISFGYCCIVLENGYKMVALLLATALDLVNTKHLKKLLSNNLPSVERQILLDAIVF